MTSVCDENTQLVFMILVGVAVTSAFDDNTQFFMILVGVSVTSACDDNTQLICTETYRRRLDPSSKEFCRYCHLLKLILCSNA